MDLDNVFSGEALNLYMLQETVKTVCSTIIMFLWNHYVPQTHNNCYRSLAG